MGEQVSSPSYGTYYVNHVDKKTQYNAPVVHMEKRHSQTAPPPAPTHANTEYEEWRANQIEPQNPYGTLNEIPAEHLKFLRVYEQATPEEIQHINWSLFSEEDIEMYHNIFTQLQKSQGAQVVSQYEALRERIHRQLTHRREHNERRP